MHTETAISVTEGDNGWQVARQDGRWVDDPIYIEDGVMRRWMRIERAVLLIVCVSVMAALIWQTHRYMIGSAGW